MGNPLRLLGIQQWPMIFAALYLEGDYKYCNATKCPLLASKTLPLSDTIKDERLQTIIDGNLTELSYTPVVLNLCYDRSCNLSCPSCRPEIITAKGEEYQLNLKLQNELLNSGLNDTELLIVTGSGDPFGSRLYKELLASLDSSTYPRLTVKLMTGGAAITTRSPPHCRCRSRHCGW